MSIKSIVDLQAAIVRRFISGETYPVICKDYDITVGKARDLSRIFIAELWGYIHDHQILHPYTPERYRGAYGSGPRAGRFYSYYLTTTDMRGEKEFWLDLIDQVLAKEGSVERDLVTTDAVSRLGLTVRVSNLLRSHNLTTIQDLLDLIAKPREWKTFPGLGEASRAFITDKLASHGFSVEPEKVLPNTMNLLRNALAYIKNPSCLSEQEKKSLIDGLEQRIELG